MLLRLHFWFGLENNICTHPSISIITNIIKWMNHELNESARDRHTKHNSLEISEFTFLTKPFLSHPVCRCRWWYGWRSGRTSHVRISWWILKNNTSLLLFLLVGYFTMLSVTWTEQHQILQWFMKDELKTIWYKTVRPNCDTISASAYSKDGKLFAPTETSAHTCNFHTDVKVNLSTYTEFHQT